MPILRASAAYLLICLAAHGETRPEQLFQAIRNNDLAFIKDQLAKSADVNTRNGRGATLLMHAAAFGSPEAVELFVGAGADVNAKIALGATALVWSATDLRKASLLIAKGADVNAHSNLGRTPLMIASTCSGCSAIVRLLLEKGADPNLKDSRGASAARLAAATDSESFRLLLKAGAPFDGADSDGVTPLMTAAAACELPTVRALVRKGARVNAYLTYAGKVKHGEIELTRITPLMFAAPFCAADVAKALLDGGADVNLKDSRGMTSLLWAIASETHDIETVRLLVKAGVNVNAKTRVGETALDWAKKFGDPEILALLEAAGARPGDPFVLPKRPDTPPKTPAEARDTGIGLLEQSTTEFFRQSGCVGCHHQNFTLMAGAAARSRGARVDENARREYVKMIESQWLRLQGHVLERFDVGGAAEQEIYALLALGAAGYPANNMTDALVALIASDQTGTGGWTRVSGVARPPAASGDIARTAFAVRALQLFGTPAQRDDLDRRIARAREFLLKAPVRTTDDAAMRLAGLHWIGRDPGEVRADDPVYRRGRQRLLDTQWQDGSWHVRSRSPKFQPYFQSGFPYDHDQWISATATAWAVMALARDEPSQ